MTSHRKSRSPSTPSEGEIIESGSEMKATASKPPLNGTSVDPSSPSAPLKGSGSPRRQRSWTRSRSRSGSRSPYRDSRSSKRRRYDNYDQYESRPSRQEPSRRYGSRYDDRPEDRAAGSHRPRSYYDYDREESYGGGLSYTDDYDQRKEKRQRTRSRSPYRHGRKPKRYDDLDPSESSMSQADSKAHGSSGIVVSEQGKTQAGAQDSKLGAETQKNQKQLKKRNQNPSMKLLLSKLAVNVARQSGRNTEARRPPLHLQALQVDTDSSTPGSTPIAEPASAQDTTGKKAQQSHTETFCRTDALLSTNIDSSRLSPSQPPNEQPDETFSDFKIGKDTDLINHDAPADGSEKDEHSAADYDPTFDMKEERQKHGVQNSKDDVSSAAYDETQATKQDILIPDTPQQPPQPKAKDPYDMFAEDVDDDMFAEEKEDHPAHASATAVPQAQELDISMMDNWDDPEGYYNTRLGELINGRYHVKQVLGKGMFSSVVRALDEKTGKLVAVKIIRQNDTMRKAGMKEIGILEQLLEADPEGKKHIIKFERYFDHKGHLCMVFENLSMNLRELLKKYGRDVGLNLRAIRAYAQQIFLGLSLLRKCNILHADLKPDNLLVNENRNVLKVCDLGSASSASENEITPYLVSRFYRAPEVMLGIPFDYAIDVWSIGCTLFELYTGKILFTGRNNNQMLRAIMECRGKYPPKLLRRGSLPICILMTCSTSTVSRKTESPVVP
ncbi:uncharacterized protein N7477_000205 [Penicillium maclennaniae]|uniref:uncharacterized protein n=1 Tax=Penicillium maclennaniae TaxID=1343394 RepID=UPI00253F9FC0|nr:uncharacterized protein N7477_000205 [Penicillium maclennaniae]KAJ5683860.1 hypothetical protein N7477_000205 [Penicillium maclennaniae]